jgi:translation initiation factor IF-1
MHTKPNYASTAHYLTNTLPDASQQLSWTDTVRFTGFIKEKLPNATFTVSLTHSPCGTPITQECLITAKMTGRIRDRNIKVAIKDKVIVSISMESAATFSGFIIYRLSEKRTT